MGHNDPGYPSTAETRHQVMGVAFYNFPWTHLGVSSGTYWRVTRYFWGSGEMFTELFRTNLPQLSIRSLTPPTWKLFCCGFLWFVGYTFHLILHFYWLSCFPVLVKHQNSTCRQASNIDQPYLKVNWPVINITNLTWSRREVSEYSTIG